jgi:CDP-glycerol glycerophosphotransferase (TagB/SpsB family)
LIGILGALRYVFKSWFVKLRFFLSGGRKTKDDGDNLPLVIFSEGKQYWNFFNPVCRELEARGVETVYMTASEEDPVLKNEYKHIKTKFIGTGNKAFAKLNFLNADIVLATTPGLDVYQWKRSREVKCYVHIMHAAKDLTLYRMFGTDYYDVLLLAGDYQVEQARSLEKLWNIPERECAIVGVPYLDEMLKRYRENPYVEKNENKVILLAPSWGESGILNRFGEKIIDELLATGYHIIVRPHPQSFVSEKEMLEKLMVKYSETNRLEWNRDNDNFEVLKKADILISDFSGVMFDFALVYDKPIIYTDTGFDKGPYDAWWLDEPLWIFEVLPKIGKELNTDNMHNLKNMIDECLSNEKYAEGREKARKDTWAHQGESAERTAEYLIQKYYELKNSEVEERK